MKNLAGRARDQLKLVWCGDCHREFAWLIDRMANLRNKKVQFEFLEDLNRSSAQMALADRLEQGGADRIVVSCRNRWDYPREQLFQLACQYPDVPVAVALSDLWLGWRRTGIGHLQTLPQITLPWYRWWDGWVPWLTGCISAMFGPFASDRTFASTEHPSDPSWEKLTHQFRSALGVVLAGCKLTDQAWRNCLGSLDMECPSPSQAIEEWLNNSSFSNEPQWILWDDTRLSTWRGFDANMDSAICELSLLHQRFPHARMWTAWNFPTWEIVSRLEKASIQVEILAKPHWLSFSSAAEART